MTLASIGLLLGGCAATDNAPLEPATSLQCPAFDIVETQMWGQGDLPSAERVDGTQPGVAIGDLDGDGWLDAFFAYAGGSLLLRNDGTGSLFEVPSFTTDGGQTPGGEAVALADIDADGDLDAHLGRWFEQVDLVLWNDGTGAFVSSELAGSEGATFSGSFADADGDSDLDLFVAAGAMNMSFEEIRDGTQTGDPNLLYLQDAAGGLVLAEDALPEDTRYGITFQGAWLDADGDDDLDVYVANDAGPWLDPNHLLLNDGAAHFTDAPDCFCDLAIYTMGAALVDPDDNGLPDLYLTDVAGPNLLINLGDVSFVDATLATHADIPPEPTSMTSWGVVSTDLNGDRETDLVVTFGQSGENFTDVDIEGTDGPDQPDVVLFGEADGTWTRATDLSFADPSRTRSVAVGDLDRDGRPDLVTAGKHFFRVWHTEGGCGPGLTVTTNAGDGNLQGIGARVTVESDGVVTHQWMMPSATGSSNAPELYFGLGGADSAERLTVRWPGGDETVLTDVPAGTLDLVR